MSEHRSTGRLGARDDAGRRSGLGLLSVAGPPAARAAVHVITGIAVVSTVLAPLFDGLAVAVLFLVLGALTLVRVLAVPAGLQVVLGAALLGAAWASVLRVYEQVWWADIAAHLVLTGALAACAGTLMLGAGLTPTTHSRRGRWGVVVTTASVGTALGVVWEVAEWVGHVFVDESIYVAYGDTVGDLAAGMVGSVAAGLLLARCGGGQ